jgi:hypothetical protein
MKSKETIAMDALLGATELHIAELDREIESIRTERLLRAATPARPPLQQRARTSVGRRLISLGQALVGDSRARPARTARTPARTARTADRG